MMVALVPDHVLEKKDGVVVMKVHFAARFDTDLYRVTYRLCAVVQHLRNALTVGFEHPLVFRQGSGELGGVLGNEHQSHIVNVGEQLGGGWAILYGPDLESAIGESAEQVDQDGVVAVPGV